MQDEERAGRDAGTVEERELQARREFLKRAGKAAMAAPALALILKAEQAQAWGSDVYGGSEAFGRRQRRRNRRRRRSRRHQR